MAVLALAVAAALVVQLRAHDMLQNATDVLGQPQPAPAVVDARLKDLKTVGDLRPGGAAAFAAASLDLHTRRYAAAARAAADATRRDPKNFAAWITRGIALNLTGDHAGAQSSFQRAHALNPLYPIPR